eukprot:TRINITY_DN1922_c0_g1_i4.p1 TRINITY_DN1922_c0_g1~~TRINITY_DN1922_c0_g1_i4.p1  ORF type:complete len:454 (+),score=96.93 TRINITY_DN1922_c0_g1_i4:58-1419(+)
MSEDVESLLKAWTAAFSEEVLDYAQPPEVRDEEVFADVYHSLIHSPLSETILQLEASYACTVETLCRERDYKAGEMEARHAKEMADAVQNVQSGKKGMIEQDINTLATTHIDERELLLSKYESELATLHQKQYSEFRQWVMCVHEEYKTSNQNPLGSMFTRSQSSFSISSQTEVSALQESFTITLGAQMKQMHNLRLIAANILDLCKYPSGEEALPQRLQTSMSLYSNNLCGLVILSDSKLRIDTGITKELSDLCSRSTEFHFPTLQTQIDNVKSDIRMAGGWRKEFHKKRLEMEARLSGEPVDTQQMSKEYTNLQDGDFYLTRHSNLCETHVVFHLISDQPLDNANVSSRHPVIIGLRNLVKTACMNDVTTLTIPLLLSHKMTERMTVAWCMKRAELMFKCIKGFMMEMAGWGGTEIKTLQFLLPADIHQDVFHKLTVLLSSIFRVSNPIRV